MTSATSSVRLVIYASYSEYGVRTEDVAVVLETFPFKHKGFFYSEKENLCFHAHFESRVSSFNLTHTHTHTQTHTDTYTYFVDISHNFQIILKKV